MEKKKISPLHAIIILVETERRKRKIMVQSLISVSLASLIYPLIGYFLNFPSFLTFLGALVVGMIFGKLWEYREGKLISEAKEFWESHDIDFSLEK